MIITIVVELNCVNKDADPTISSVKVEHSPLFVGDTEKVNSNFKLYRSSTIQSIPFRW